MSVASYELPDVAEIGRVAEAKRLLTLAWTLALTDWRLRFYGSVLGVLWALIRPLALFGVILFVFTEIAHLDRNVHHFSTNILFSLVLFGFFGEITAGSVMSLVARESLLRKMQFNPIVVPLALTMTALLNLGMTFLAVLVFAFANGVFPDWGWLELPVLIVMLTLFAVGLGMILSVMYVRFRDVQPIWEVVMQMLFYASSVLYVATTVPAKYRPWFLCNPLSATFAQMRHAIVDPTAPTVTYLMGARVVIPIVLVFGTFVVGLWFFIREAPRLAENL